MKSLRFKPLKPSDFLLILFSVQRLHVLCVSLNANWASFEFPKNSYLTISLYEKMLVLQFQVVVKCLSYNFHIWKNVHSKISIMKNYLSYNFYIWKNVYPTISLYEKTLILEFFLNNFLSLWSCRKLKDKHFFIYGNCRTSIFGQPMLWCSWNTIYNFKKSA